MSGGAGPGPSLPTAVEPWTLMVRVLGPVDVVDRGGQPASFERAKALELVVWLAQHQQSATRAGARAALWELDVSNASFSNVVSEARRALARLATSPDGEDWIARTYVERLPLHDRVVLDADLVHDHLTARSSSRRRRRRRRAAAGARPGPRCALRRSYLLVDGRRGAALDTDPARHHGRRRARSPSARGERCRGRLRGNGRRARRAARTRGAHRAPPAGPRPPGRPVGAPAASSPPTSRRFSPTRGTGSRRHPW